MSENAIIFGPTAEGTLAFELLKRKFNVVAFCDNDERKLGMSFLGLPIISPSELRKFSSNVIVVANYKYESAISFQLINMGIENIFIFTEGDGLDCLLPICSDKHKLYNSMMMERYSRYNHRKNFYICEHEVEFDKESVRVFHFTFFKYGGECGGPSGVMFRLQQANQRSKFVKNDFYIFGDKVIRPLDSGFSPCYISPQYENIFDSVYALLGDSFPCALPYKDLDILYDRLIWMQFYMDRLLELHREISFSPLDVYIFHDVESAFIFSSLFSFSRTSLVYHAQGGMYYEYLAYGGFPSDSLRLAWGEMHKYCLSKIGKTIFPSLGGYDSLVETAPELENVLTNYDVIYNGCHLSSFSPSEHTKILLENFILPDSIKFVTVAMLNDAKAIERIPVFLGDLMRRTGRRIQWIQVGTGPRAGVLNENINKYNMGEHVLWLKEAQHHSDIQYIMALCDYYIILQKYSICDFATIEAMGRGCIPVLSNVSGNRAYLAYNNGVLVNDYTDSSAFVDFYNNKCQVELSLLNVNIQRKHFSAESFLQGYKDLIMKLECKPVE